MNTWPCLNRNTDCGTFTLTPELTTVGLKQADVMYVEDHSPLCQDCFNLLRGITNETE